MCMNNQNYLIDALDTVLSWDIDDDLIPMAVTDQAKLKAGFDAGEIWHSVPDYN